MNASSRPEAERTRRIGPSAPRSDGRELFAGMRSEPPVAEPGSSPRRGATARRTPDSEPGRILPAIGATAFDVDDGGPVLVLDEAHRRALRWQPGRHGPLRAWRSRSTGASPTWRWATTGRSTCSSRSPLQDERRSCAVSTPGGRALGAVETAERAPPCCGSARTGPSYSSGRHTSGCPWRRRTRRIEPRDQQRKARAGAAGSLGWRGRRAGGGDKVLAALVSNGRVQRSWSVTSETPLAEVQLAEPLGHRLLPGSFAPTRTRPTSSSCWSSIATGSSPSSRHPRTNGPRPPRLPDSASPAAGSTVWIRCFGSVRRSLRPRGVLMSLRALVRGRARLRDRTRCGRQRSRVPHGGSSPTTATLRRRQRRPSSRATARRQSHCAPDMRGTSGREAAGTTMTATTRRTIRMKIRRRAARAGTAPASRSRCGGSR